MRLCEAERQGRQPPGEPSACQPETEHSTLSSLHHLDPPHLPDDEPGQRHPSDGADQLDGGAVVDVAVPHSELLGLVLVVVN